MGIELDKSDAPIVFLCVVLGVKLGVNDDSVRHGAVRRVAPTSSDESESTRGCPDQLSRVILVLERK